MPFDTREFEWADISLNINGVEIDGFTSVKYTEKIETEPLYGKGRYPHSIQTGNVSYEGTLELFQSVYEALVLAGKGSVLKLRNVSINVKYGNPSNGSPMISDTITGIQFTEGGKEFKQGDKNAKISLPFQATAVKNQVPV